MKRPLRSNAVPGAALLVSHRCLPHCHALRFARWRSVYRGCLAPAARAARPLCLLGYLLTRDSMHVLLQPAAPSLSTAFMQRLQGRTAVLFKARFTAPGPIWHGRHSLTLVQAGHPLLQAVLAMDLHMCTTGRIHHPAEWKDCGWQELSGTRVRYRAFRPDLARQSLGLGAESVGADAYISLTEACLRDLRHGSLPLLVSALAFGDSAWIDRLAAAIPEKRRTVRRLAPAELPIPADNLAVLSVSRRDHRHYITRFARLLTRGGNPQA